MAQSQYPKKEIPSEKEIFETLKKEGMEEFLPVLKEHWKVADLMLRKILRNKDEIKNIIETLKKEGLEDFLEDVVLAHNPKWVLDDLLKRKNALKRIIDKYEKNNTKVAFGKADNRNTFISIIFRTPEEKEKFMQMKVDMEDVKNGKEPQAIEMPYEEFTLRFKPKMIWYKHKGGISKEATYSALMSGYRFARNYKVVLIPIRSIDDEDIQIISKLSKNVYPLSDDNFNELLPIGLAIFIPS